jgi:hypothetical protein
VKLSRFAAAVRLALPALIVLASGTSHAQDTWTYEASPFLWAAGLEGREGFGGVTADVDAQFKDLIEFVDIGLALRIVARRPPMGWFAEASYVEVQDDVDSALLGPVRFSSTQTFAEGGIQYELNSAFAVYGGLRFQSLELDIRTTPARLEQTEEWIDAIVGARWTPLVSDSWVIWARGDVGGGSSDLVWLAEVGGGYRWNTTWGAYLAYRVLDTDYEHGGFVYDIRQSGLLFGFGYRF